MKIREGVYIHPPCGVEIHQKVNRVEGNGRKGTAVAMVTCPKCFNLVSQKTKIEIESKLDKGEKI